VWVRGPDEQVHELARIGGFAHFEGQA
jgi:hypothetical protein